MPRSSRFLVSAAIVLSGAAALAYEVVWTRQLSVFLGITLRAETVVLAAFMLGLALGSRVLGRWADRSRHPLLLFAGLEAALGLYGGLTITLLPRLAPWYASFANPDALSTPAADLTRFLIAAMALGIPTFAMGGTVPALVRAGLGDGGAERDVGLDPVIGRVYAWNTLGAALGAFAAGFLLLPRWGVPGTLAIAAGSNFAIALAAWAVHRRRAEASRRFKRDRSAPPDRATRPEAEARAPAPSHRPTLLRAFAVFGAAALALQLGWIQALTQILGSSVYALSLTLSGYLAGLAAGGLAFTAWSGRRTRTESGASLPVPAWLAPSIASAAAASVLLGLLAFDRLPEWFLLAFRWELEGRFAAMTVFSFLTAWLVVLVPTALFGFLSPLVASACAVRSTAGEDVGTAYAFNSAGAALGALVAGFWLLPRTGQQNTLLLGAIGIAVSAGLLYLGRRPRGPWSRAKAGAAVLGFALVAASTPRWDPVLITSGVFVNASRILDLAPDRSLREALSERNRLLFYRESAIGSVSVRDVADDRLLVINGKTDGSRAGDRRTQLALGHLPALLHRDPEEALVVGFGTGMTAAALAAHPQVQRIDVIEISPEVVEASRFFAAENRGVLFDPRLRLHHADARNFMLASRRSWDVIVSEPSNPWISGVANLFTREYFELARGRLRRGGVMAQWFQGYGMSLDDLRSVVGTFADVFDEVTIWSSQPGDLILVGSDAPHALDAERLRGMERIAASAQDLVETGWNGSEAFPRMLLADSRSAETFAAGAPRNTDAHPRIEFDAPRHLYRETTFDNMLALVEHAGDRESVVPILGHLDAASRRVVARSDPARAGIEVRPEVRVRWTAFEAARPGPVPTLGVSLRRLIVVEGLAEDPEGPVEIDVFDEVESPSRARREERLRSLLAEPVAEWSAAALADGTPTLRAATAAQIGVAWSCAAPAPAGTLYVAVVAPRLLEPLEAALGCVDS